jgi:small-conductance mechanosensitive channel
MRTRRFAVTVIATVGAAAAVGVGYHFGGELHTHNRHIDAQHRVIAYSAAAAFIILGAFVARQIANGLGEAVAQADRASASLVRLVLTIIGVVVVVLVALAMLHIGVSQLFLGGAITGIVVGIAAQQSLGNMFAGIVLLLARPFRVGDHIRVRTGMLGGIPFEGDVVSMGLTYVTFTTAEGTTLVPNLTLLASGIVRSPRPLSEIPGAVPSTPSTPSAPSAPAAPPAAPAATPPFAAQPTTTSEPAAATSEPATASEHAATAFEPAESDAAS